MLILIKNYSLKIDIKQIFTLFIIFSLTSFAQNFSSIDNNSVRASTRSSYAKDEEKFSSFEGKIIRRINIYVRDVSSPVSNDDTQWKPSWFGKIGNSLHVKSKKWVVRNELLFKEGDKLNPRLLYESERILRKSDVFLDANIKPLPVKNANDSVDVNVIVQDKWTISLQFSYKTNYKTGYLGLSDQNFLGFGHFFEAKYTHDENSTIGSGGNIRYTATNIGGTFINADGKFETDNSSNFKSIGFSRPFTSIYIPWSGALTFSWNNNIFRYSNDSIGTVNFPFLEITQDIWIGKTFQLWFLSSDLKRNTEAFLSARTLHVDYPERPVNSIISGRLFNSFTQYLFGTGILRKQYYEDNYVDGFGITEDIPVGGMLSLILGKDIGALSSRWYTGIEAIYSRRLTGIGYSSLDLKLGGFKNMRNWEQNLLNFNFIYHSILFKKEKWKYRYFLQADLLYGFNRLQGEQIYLNSENNIRGLDNILLYGTKRITLNLEARIFSPFSPLGFVLGGIIFSDFGLISNAEVNLSNSKLYQSYGIGIRTRNQSITNTNFSISLAYIPINNRTTGGTFKIIFNTTFVLGSRDFGLSAPSIFQFGNNQQTASP
ncbi:MAG: hypothetical protein WCE54_18125 [Ignavibacteriaceae bacterium]